MNADRVDSHTERAISTLVAGTGMEEEIEAAQLLAFFQSELQTQLNDLEHAVISDDLSVVRRISHQLHGAAAGFGFPEISDAAAHVHLGLYESDASITSLKSQVEELIRQCHIVIDQSEAHADKCTGSMREEVRPSHAE